jgi:DNA repair protein RecO (recombination protein O)
MSLQEAEAIVLRTYPLGEADRIAVLFARAFGKLRGVARGARRPKSRFGSSLEPLSRSRVWFYDRETRELVRLSQAEVIESFVELQSDYPLNLALSFLAEVSDALLPDREVSDAEYRLLLMVLGALKRTRQAWLPLTYFRLWMTRLAGWLPSLDSCGRCRGSLLGSSAFGHPARGRVACPKCRLPGMRMLRAASLDRARQMLTEPLSKLGWQGWTRTTAPDLDAFLDDVIEHHIERKLRTRALIAALENS